MRLLFIILAICLTGCASLETVKTPKAERIGLKPRTLLPGDCGLFVWKADSTKTFILYADQNTAVLYRDGKEMSLTSIANTSTTDDRKFIDSNGKSLTLSLLNPQAIEGSTRYKSGRLIGSDANGWDIVTPIVGIFTCQPVSS